MTPARIVRIFAFAGLFGWLIGAMAGGWGLALGIVVGAALAWPGE